MEYEKRRKDKEEEENAKLREQEALLKEKMDGIKQLIKPIQNEDKRLEALMQDPEAQADLKGRTIVRPGTPEELKRDNRDIQADLKKLDLIHEDEESKI